MISPADVVNRSLDAIGCGATLSDPDLAEGTREAEAARRIYGPTLRQLLRAALWNFSRRQATLTLLQDSTGATTAGQQAAGQPPSVGTGTPGMGPWQYEYAWPVDCVRARYLPLRVPPSNPPGVPIMTGLGSTAPLLANIPARFVITNDAIPNLAGAITSWDQLPALDRTMGQGLASQTVILTNVQNATLVYTALITFPDQWDPCFQQAMVAALAERLAMVCLDDKKFAIAMRSQQIAVAKAALDAARISDGDEGWNKADIPVDWIRTRASGSCWNAWGDGGGPGMLYCGWASYGFSDGCAY